jgi:RNA polymerase sigma factor (sigma-70 family)
VRHRRALARLALDSEPDFGDEAAARLDDERVMRRALAALAGLRDGEREVFLLCAWHGLSYEDAAVALGVPVGTVRSRLSRARAKVRELEPRGGHEADEGRVQVAQAQEVAET